MRDLPTFLAGGMAGFAILRLHTDSATYTRALGLLLLANGAVLIVRKPVIVSGSHPAIDLGDGFLSGIIGGVAGLPRAFVAPWCG